MTIAPRQQNTPEVRHTTYYNSQKSKRADEPSLLKIFFKNKKAGRRREERRPTSPTSSVRIV
jgi:hypothetical protein